MDSPFLRSLLWTAEIHIHVHAGTHGEVHIQVETVITVGIGWVLQASVTSGFSSYLKLDW